MNTTVRTTILCIILVIIASLFGYDQFVAKARQRHMLAELDKMRDETKDYTEDYINTLFNKTGTVFQQGQYAKWIKYSFMRGNFIHSYDLYVKYTKKKDAFVMSGVSDVIPDESTIENKDASKPSELARRNEPGCRGTRSASVYPYPSTQRKIGSRRRQGQFGKESVG